MTCPACRWQIPDDMVVCLNPVARQRLMVPVVPFSEIRRVGASMYRGVREKAVEEDEMFCHLWRSQISQIALVE